MPMRNERFIETRLLALIYPDLGEPSVGRPVG